MIKQLWRHIFRRHTECLVPKKYISGMHRQPHYFQDIKTCKGHRKRYALGRPTRLRYYGTLRVPREHGARGRYLFLHFLIYLLYWLLINYMKVGPRQVHIDIILFIVTDGTQNHTHLSPYKSVYFASNLASNHTHLFPYKSVYFAPNLSSTYTHLPLT